MKKAIVSNSEKNWLVKASESILGPHSVDELALLIRSKQLGLLDEAKKQNTRWLFIRDIPELQAAVLELANQSETIEKTQTEAHTQLSVTRKLDDDLTPVPVRPTPKATITVEPVATANTGKIKIEPVKSYSLNSSSQPLNLKKWGLHALVGVCAVIAILTYADKKTKESHQKRIWTQVQQLFASKLYDRAYDAYKDYRLEPQNQSLALMRLGLLHLNPGHDLVKAKRFFESSSLLDPKNKDLVIQNLNGLALIALYDGQIDTAEQYLVRASTLERNNSITQLNLIATQMAASKWNEAMAAAQKLASQEPRKAYLIQSIIVALSGNFKVEIPSLIGALNATSDLSLYLRPEMKLMSIHLSILQKSNSDIQLALQNFFKELPSFSMSFSEDPTVDQRWRDWNYLYQFCNDLDADQAFAADISAVKVICLTQVQRWAEAEKLISESLIRFPGNARVQLAQLHLLSQMGRWPEIRGFSKIPNLISDESSVWYFARTCFEENQEGCLDNYLNSGMQKANVKTYFYILKAKQKCRQKIYDGCRYLISQGLSQDPLSTELLSLRYDLEEQL
ncbi:MAG: tetratricopeptide repeat protein [Bdellovibrionales bacterium]